MWTLLVFLSLLYLTTAEDAVQEFTNANNIFTRNAYKEIGKTNSGNFLFSPFSAETVLAFTQSGSKGKTAEEIRSALHLPNDKEKVESALKSLLPKFKSNKYSLYTANKIYIKQNFTIKNEFKEAADLVYQAKIENIDFLEKVEAAKSINSWVEKQTNNKIKNLVNSNDLDKFTRAVLVNALYFKANWSTPFQLESTTSQDFYRSSNDVVKVDTLHHWDTHLKYYECQHLKAQFLELPFQDEETTMVIVLPNKKDGLSNIENQLEQVFSPHQLKTTFLNVALPKFKIETSIDFKDVLQNLGVTDLFKEKIADLSGIAGDPGDLFVKKVAQKTFIDVSEEGVEAAAATFVLVAVPESAYLEEPKNFVADHPFIFYIKVKGVIIFAGRVTDPSKV